MNLLTTLAIAAGTDYAIFLVGRYHEARDHGEDRETAFYTMYHGTAHVILGSGLTIAGATFCLHFTRLPYFQTLGIPLAIGMLVAVVGGADHGAGRADHLQSVRPVRSEAGDARPAAGAGSAPPSCDGRGRSSPRRWRSRWSVCWRCRLQAELQRPKLPARQTSRPIRATPRPTGTSPQARMNPEMLLVETDHDLRNSADMLVVDRIAKGIFHIPGIGSVQTITRPQGTPIEHTSIPFLISMQGTSQQMNQDYMDKVMANMLTQANDMQTSINTMERMQAITVQMAATTHGMVEKTQGMTVDIQRTARPHRRFRRLLPAAAQLLLLGTALLRHPDLLVVQVDLRYPRRHRHDDRRHPESHAEHGSARLAHAADGRANAVDDRDDEEHAAHHADDVPEPEGSAGPDEGHAGEPTAMGQAFDASKNDDSFYLPPEVFDNPDFKRGMKMFVSPDGKAVRFIISHEGDPATPEGIAHDQRRSRTRRSRPSRAPRWRARRSIWRAPRPPTRTCRRAPTTTC